MSGWIEYVLLMMARVRSRFLWDGWVKSGKTDQRVTLAWIYAPGALLKIQTYSIATAYILANNFSSSQPADVLPVR